MRIAGPGGDDVLMTTPTVELRLTSDEALVLFDVLHRWEDDGQAPTSDVGEREAFNALSCALETALVEPFDADYDALVRSARARLGEN